MADRHGYSTEVVPWSLTSNDASSAVEPSTTLNDFQSRVRTNLDRECISFAEQVAEIAEISDWVEWSKIHVVPLFSWKANEETLVLVAARALRLASSRSRDTAEFDAQENLIELLIYCQLLTLARLLT